MEIIDLYKEALQRDLIKPGRRSGNTTRMVDLAIQLLFEGKKVRISDHYDSENMIHYITRRIVDRLNYEHNGIMRQDLLSYDKKESIMHLKEVHVVGLCPLCWKPCSIVVGSICKECQTKKSEENENIRAVIDNDRLYINYPEAAEKLQATKDKLKKETDEDKKRNTDRN